MIGMELSVRRPRILRAIVFLCISAGITAGFAADIYWTNTAGGNWSVAANWSPNTVPGSSDNALIVSNGTYTVNLSANATVSNLVVGATSGTQTFSNSANTLVANRLSLFDTNCVLVLSGGTIGGPNTLNGTLNWSSGTLSGNWNVATGAVVNLTGGSSKGLSGFLTNSGTVNVVGAGDMNVGSSQIYNATGALFDFQSDQNFNGFANAVFTNAGTLRKSGAGGTSTMGMIFRNTGNVTNQNGTMLFNSGGTLDGSFTALAGSTVNFTAGTFTLDGTPAFIGPGTVAITAGNIQFTVPITNFTLSAGTLIGTNTVNGTLNWAGGTISGACLISTGAFLAINGTNSKGLSGVLTNSGTVTLGGSGNLNVGSSQIYNLGGALFDIQSDQTLNGFANALFVNAGTLQKSGAGGTTQFSMIIQNTGNVTNLNGTILFNLGGTLDGTFNASAGSTVSFVSGTFTFDGTPVFSGPGSVGITGGNVQFTVPITNFTLSAGTLVGTNAINGVFNWTGGIISGAYSVSTGAVLNITGGADKSLRGPLTNSGTIYLTGTGALGMLNAGQVYNQPGAIFEIQSDTSISTFANVVFYNFGIFRKSAGTGTNSLGINFLNYGDVVAQVGTMQFIQSGTLDGTFTASNSAAIYFSAGTFTLDIMPNFFGPGAVAIIGGNVQFTVPITNFTHAGGTLIGTNAISGVLNWTGGNISGAYTVSTGAVLNISGSTSKSFSDPITNFGTIYLGGTGLLNIINAGQVYNQPGALFEVQSDANITSFANVLFYNFGLFRKSAGTGTNSLGVNFLNYGAVVAQIGTMQFIQGGTLDGTFTASNGAAIYFAGAGTFTLDVMPNFFGPGTVAITGGNVQFTVPISNFTLSGGTLIGTNAISGVLNWTGGNISAAYTVSTGAVLNITGSADKGLSRPLTNFGTIYLSGSGVLNIFNAGQVYNQPGALFEIQSDTSITSFANVPFFNFGTFRKSGGSGSSSIQPIFNNSGTIEPGAGVLIFSSLVTLSATSILHFGIGGETPDVQFGQLTFSTPIQLNGTLSVQLTNGFSPNVGDSFRLITWNSQSGGFSQENGLDLGNWLFWQAVCDNSGLSLVTKTSIVAGAPPATNLVDQVVAFGDTGVLNIAPNGTEPFTYQWQHAGTNLAGQTDSILILTNVQSVNTGAYCVVVVDGFFATNNYCATLSALIAPSITVGPGGVTNNAGSNVTFTVTATGSSPLRYQWRLNGANIFGATNSTCSITNAQPRDGGAYDVLVANRARAIASSIAYLKVSSTTLPFGDDFAARGTITGFTNVGSGSNSKATREVGEPLHADKFGSNSVWLQWTAPASGVATFNTRGSAFDTLVGVYTGPNVSNLTAVASDDDRGGYFTSEAVFNATNGSAYSIAIDGLASSRGNIVLTWNLDTNITEVPRIIQQPADVTTSLGGSASYSVFAASTSNRTYQWYFNCCLALPGQTNSTLTISNVTPLQIGTYRVEVTGAGQTIRSQDALLEVGPASTAHSYDKLQELLAAEGAFGLLGVNKMSLGDVGFPSLSLGSLGFQLINNFNSTTDQGEPIHSSTVGGSSRWYEINAADTGTMIVDTIGSDIDTILAIYTGADIFSLIKIASDNNGAPDGIRSKVTFPATNGVRYLIAVDGVNGAQGNINVNWRFGNPPTAGTGPATNVAALEGTALLLTTSSTNGFPPPSFQWRLNGASIAGATNSSYAVPALKYTNNGLYTVVVSNLVGLLTNTVASVSLQVPLRLDLDTSSGAPKFRIEGTATQAVAIQISTNLGSWRNVFTNANPNAALNYLDALAPSRTAAFYRLVKWP